MKKVISALLVVSGLAFLTACDSSIAAQIGDTKISTNTVQDRVAEILSERRNYDTAQMQLSVAEELNRSELRFLMISVIFEKLAKEGGIKITQAMKDAKKSDIYNQVGGYDQLAQALVQAQMAPADFDLYVQSLLISEQLVAKAKAAGVSDENTGAAVQQLVMGLTQREKVKVNPQYGAWDPTTADLATFDSAGTAVKSLTA